MLCVLDTWCGRRKTFLFCSMISPPFWMRYGVAHRSDPNSNGLGDAHCAVPHVPHTFWCGSISSLYEAIVITRQKTKYRARACVCVCAFLTSSIQKHTHTHWLFVCVLRASIEQHIWTFVVIAWSLNAFPEWYNVFEMEFRQWLQLLPSYTCLRHHHKSVHRAYTSQWVESCDCCTNKTKMRWMKRPTECFSRKQPAMKES